MCVIIQKFVRWRDQGQAASVARAEERILDVVAADETMGHTVEEEHQPQWASQWEKWRDRVMVLVSLRFAVEAAAELLCADMAGWTSGGVTPEGEIIVDIHNTETGTEMTFPFGPAGLAKTLSFTVECATEAMVVRVEGTNKQWSWSQEQWECTDVGLLLATVLLPLWEAAVPHGVGNA